MIGEIVSLMGQRSPDVVYGTAQGLSSGTVALGFTNGGAVSAAPLALSSNIPDGVSVIAIASRGDSQMIQAIGIAGWKTP